MNVSSSLQCFNYKPFTIQTRDKLLHPKILLVLLWKGLGRRGPLGEGRGAGTRGPWAAPHPRGTSPWPLKKQHGAGLIAARAAVDRDRRPKPLQWGRSEVLPRWEGGRGRGRGSKVPGRHKHSWNAAQARSQERPDVKAAPRGKGEKVSRSFPTNLIPGYAAPPFQSWVEHWELTARRGKEPHSLLVLSGSWHLLSAGMKNDEIFQEDLQGGGGEAIKRNTQKRCEVRSKAMGTEAMERVWNWKANQKCQRHQQNGERKATAEARTSRGVQT